MEAQSWLSLQQRVFSFVIVLVLLLVIDPPATNDDDYEQEHETTNAACLIAFSAGTSEYRRDA